MRNDEAGRASRLSEIERILATAKPKRSEKMDPAKDSLAKFGIGTRNISGGSTIIQNSVVVLGQLPCSADAMGDLGQLLTKILNGSAEAV